MATLITITSVSGAGPSYQLAVATSAGVALADHVSDNEGSIYRVSGVPSGIAIDVEDDVAPDAPEGTPATGLGSAYMPTPNSLLSQAPFGAPAWDEIKRRDMRKIDSGLGAAAFVGNAAPLDVGTADPGASSDASRIDHVHAHGSQAGGALHAAATGSVSGFMSDTDKAKLDAIEAGAKDDQAASEVPFTPDGDIAATDVQAAVVEVRDDTDTKLNGKLATSHEGAGGAVHAEATTGVAGFLSSGDKTKLDGLDALTTKGDLLAYGTGPQRLAVGADGTFLSADSSDPSGLTWGAPLPESFEVSGSTDQASSTLSYIVATGMTITPGAGNYLAFAHGNFDGAGSDEEVEMAIFANGVQVANAETTETIRKNKFGSVNLHARVIGLAGAQAIDMRWRTADGETLTLRDRNLALIRVA